VTFTEQLRRKRLNFNPQNPNRSLFLLFSSSHFSRYFFHDLSFVSSSSFIIIRASIKDTTVSLSKLSRYQSRFKQSKNKPKKLAPQEKNPKQHDNRQKEAENEF
jgi:hypothetical protein